MVEVKESTYKETTQLHFILGIWSALKVFSDLYCLENVDWVSELHLSGNDVSLSSELFLRKVEKLINFWAEKTVKQAMAKKQATQENVPCKGSIT